MLLRKNIISLVAGLSLLSLVGCGVEKDEAKLLSSNSNGKAVGKYEPAPNPSDTRFFVWVADNISTNGVVDAVRFTRSEKLSLKKGKPFTVTLKEGQLLVHGFEKTSRAFPGGRTIFYHDIFVSDNEVFFERYRWGNAAGYNVDNKVSFPDQGLQVPNNKDSVAGIETVNVTPDGSGLKVVAKGNNRYEVTRF